MTGPISATACESGASCPAVRELPGGDFAVTGILDGHDTAEATVYVPAAVMLAFAEQVRAEQDAARWAQAEQEFRAAWDAAKHDRGLRIMPDGAVAWHRRTPEQRRAYLMFHRDEAIAYGIPGDLVDLLIAEAEDAETTR